MHCAVTLLLIFCTIRTQKKFMKALSLRAARKVSKYCPLYMAIPIFFISTITGCSKKFGEIVSSNSSKQVIAFNKVLKALEAIRG